MVNVELKTLERLETLVVRAILVLEKEVLPSIEPKYREKFNETLKELYETSREIQALIENSKEGRFNTEKIQWKTKNDFQWAKDDGSDDFAKLFFAVKSNNGLTHDGYRYWIISSSDKVVGRKKLVNGGEKKCS